MGDVRSTLTGSKWMYVPVYSPTPFKWEYFFYEDGRGESVFHVRYEGNDMPVIALESWKYKFLSENEIEITFDDSDQIIIVNILINNASVTTYKKKDSNHKYVFKKKLFCSSHIFPSDSNFPFETYDPSKCEFLGYEEKQVMEKIPGPKVILPGEGSGFDVDSF